MVKYSYDAWGNCEWEVLDEEYATMAELNPFRYRSYYFDTETNLYFLQTRYYDPETGRFLSQDDVSYLDPEHINGLNLYAYCGNNPVMNVDPTGTIPQLVLVLIALICASTAVFAVQGGFSAALNGEDILTGIGNGALTGLMVGGSLSLIFGGCVAMGNKLPFVGTVLIAAGVGSLVGLGVNLYGQLKRGGYGSLDMGKVAMRWGAGLGIGALAGATGYACAEIGRYAGGWLGLMLASKTFLGIEIASVLSSELLFNTGWLLGGAVGGFLGGRFINWLMDDLGWQEEDVPMWLIAIIKWLGGLFGGAL